MVKSFAFIKFVGEEPWNLYWWSNATVGRDSPTRPGPIRKSNMAHSDHNELIMTHRDGDWNGPSGEHEGSLVSS